VTLGIILRDFLGAILRSLLLPVHPVKRDCPMDPGIVYRIVFKEKAGRLERRLMQAPRPRSRRRSTPDDPEK
jgi:hypothetical protein